RHWHDGGAASETVSGFHPGRLLDRTPLWRHWAGACYFPQAGTHDGRRRDRDERAGQGFGVHRALAWGLNVIRTSGDLEEGGIRIAARTRRGRGQRHATTRLFLSQCQLRSESDRSAALPQSVAMCQQQTHAPQQTPWSALQLTLQLVEE